jgi:hypothetical protein
MTLVGLLATGDAIAGTLLGGFLADRLGRRRAIVLGAVVVAVAHLVFSAVTPTWSRLIVYLIAAGLSAGVLYAATVAFYMDLTHPRLPATHFQLFMAMLNVRLTWASFAGGRLAEPLGRATMFALAAVIELAPLALLLLIDPRRAQRQWRRQIEAERLGAIIAGVKLKLDNVSVDGGQLRFRVPAGWKQSVERDGGAAFYDREQDGGTLRVKVMTFTSEDDLSGHRALDELEAMEAEPGQTLEALPSGNALRSHRERAEAGDERTLLHVWLLAGIDPPHRMRLAVFSLTIPELDADRARTIVATLEEEIRQARFAHQVS